MCKHPLMKTIQHGFTLIELMIVIAIIGILAAIAIPAYQNYTIRAQVTEGVSLASGWKTAVSEYYAQYGSFPASSTTATTGAAGDISVSGASSGKYVSLIKVVAGGEIVVAYGGSQANAKIPATMLLTFNPGLTTNGDVVWICGTAPVPTTPVLGTAPAGATVTNIPAAYLPTSCHA
jgi:type IV pilus assembly protein PilA